MRFSFVYLEKNVRILYYVPSSLRHRCRSRRLMFLKSVTVYRTTSPWKITSWSLKMLSNNKERPHTAVFRRQRLGTTRGCWKRTVRYSTVAYCTFSTPPWTTHSTMTGVTAYSFPPRKRAPAHKWAISRVHKNKSMQRLISSLWGTGTAKFQVTWLLRIVQKGVSMWQCCAVDRWLMSAAYRCTTLIRSSLFSFLFSSRKLAERARKGKKVRLI